MKKELINKEVSKRICKHMNTDHKDAINLYAKFYGGIPNPTNASIIEITKFSMTLSVEGKSIVIDFDHVLEDSVDAHHTLVKMSKCLLP